MGLREFVDRGLLPSDAGGRLEWTPLLEAVVACYERGAGTNAVCSVRQNGKSSAAMLLATFELFARPNSYVLLVAGGSREQGSAILVQKIVNWLRRSRVRELLPRLDISRTRLGHPDIGSVVEVVSASEASAPGRRVSLLLIDEARSVEEELVGVLRPAIATGGRCFYFGSAGAPATWWWRAIHEPEPEDRVHEFTEVVNPSVDASFVEAERRRLGKTVLGELLAQREWGGAWVALSEHPLLRPSDVEAASRESVDAYRSGETCFTGIDLSLTRDRTSIVTVAVDRDGRVRLIDAWVWNPEMRGPVSLEQVESAVEQVHRRFRPRKVLLDAYQGVLLAERLRRHGVRIEAVHVTSAVNQTVFTGLAEVLSERRLTWRRDDRLERELIGLEIKETQTGGFRVVDADRRYHRDVAFALALAVHAALSQPRSSMSVVECSRWWRPGEPERLETVDGLPWWRSSREFVRPDSRN